MTWQEIYNLTVFKIWGTSVPPAGVQNVLQGQYGLIANAHRKIQKDYNYWFMEATATNALIAGTANYALPAGFKEIIREGIRLVDATSGDYNIPIKPLMPNDAYIDHRGASDEADYPNYYEIYGGELVLYPTPSLDGVVLNMRCYVYLDRPPAVFDATYDDLTRNGHGAIVALAAAEMCKIQEEYQKAQVFEAEAAAEIELLKVEDDRLRRAEIRTCEYAGF